MKTKELNIEIESVIRKLIRLVADEYLDGKPEILCFCLYSNLKKALLKEINNIEETFKD